MAEAALGPHHLEVATCLNNLAVLYKYTAQFAEAGRLYRRALAITQRALGPDHPDVATLYHNLSGLEHYEVAITCNNLAALAHARGNDSEAERLYRRALAIKEKLLGPDHPDVAMTLNNLAVLYKSGGQ